jgi:hypothetical protein
MSRTSLFLLLLIVSAAISCTAQTAQPVVSGPLIAAAENLPSMDVSDGSQSFQITPTSPRDDGAVLLPGDICYKIRAYIFKRDDDHAPEMVRSTTCGPRIPHQKNVSAPKAKLVPAN